MFQLNWFVLNVTYSDHIKLHLIYRYGFYIYCFINANKKLVVLTMKTNNINASK